MYKTKAERELVERVRKQYEAKREPWYLRRAIKLRTAILWAVVAFWISFIGALWFAVGGA